MKKNNTTGNTLTGNVPTKHFLLIMRTVFILLFTCVFCSMAEMSYTQNARVTIHKRHVTLREVLTEIENQTDYLFIYNNEVNVNEKVSIRAKQQAVSKVLATLLKDKDVSYSMEGSHIILSMIEKTDDIENEAVVAVVQQQKKTITGTVVDANGEPIIGANIIEAGTTNGTVTDVNGKFSLNVEDNATIRVSYIGYLEQNINTSEKVSFDITLIEDTRALDEVIVVGYGTQRKATLTGSITGASSEEIIKAPVIGVSNAIAGLLPGVIVSNRSGQPGSTSSILIRGRNTTGDNNPLVVVDGIQGYSGWQYLNPDDIESISVLKDASAAIYGAQAANGVIVITTKRGKTGKPTFNYTLSEGLSQLTRVPEMADAVLYTEFANEYRARFGQPPLYSEEAIQKYKDGTDPFYPNTNWYKEVLKKFTPQRQHNISMTGGTDKFNYHASGSYSSQDGIFKTGDSYFKNYSLMARLDGQINENLKMGVDINSALRDNYNTGFPFGSMGTNLPTVPVYWPNGMPSSGVTAGDNPAMQSSELSGYTRGIVKQYSAKASLEVKIPWVTGMSADGYFAYINNTTFNKNWQKPYMTNSYSHATGQYSEVRGGPQTPRLTERADSYSKSLTFLRLKYEKRINNHSINTFVAFEQSLSKSNYLSAQRVDYLSDLIDQLFAGGASNQEANGSASEGAGQHYLGRISYGYADKYLLDFNFRYDGSSNFPKDKRWGFFPGISAGWRISEENFIKDNFNSIGNLKVRGSYGQIGNDRVPSFQWLSTYSMSSRGYAFGRSPSTTLGLASGVNPNPYITWEVAEITNLGLDALLVNNLLEITFDVFKQKRSNILAKRDLSVPGNTGLILPNENIGIVENKGVELEVTHQKKISDFSYSIGGNIAYAKSKIIDIDEAKNIPEWQKQEGRIIGSQLLYKAVKIIRTEEELQSIPVYPGTKVGDLQYEDIDGNGIISDADMMRVDQSSIPEITFGANVNFSYKRFSLWAHFTGQTRAWVQYHKHSKGAGHNSLKELLENRYTPGSMDSKYPIIPDSESRNMDINGFPSTFWHMDASFIRLKSLQLAYLVPNDLLSRFKINQMQVILSGSNLFTIDKIKWYDPEGDNLTGAFYPQSKVYNITLKISF